jgi:hypothetical protein
VTDSSFAEFVRTWNRRQGQPDVRIHMAMAHWLQRCCREGRRHLLLQAFRSAGKSTLVGLYCGWLLGCDPNLRILVLAADQALAVKMVRNVRRLVERHPWLAGLRPRRPAEWASDQFTVARTRDLRDPSMLARGITGNTTGSRAEVIICDDVEVPNTCDTADKRAELRRRLGEIDFLLVPGGTQIYIGTPHTYYTIYAETPRLEAGEDRPFLAGFTRLTLPILDAAGQSVWPERYPRQHIEELRRRSGPNRFASQMLLRPVNPAEGRLDPDRLRRYTQELDYVEGNAECVLSLGGQRLVSAACWWDPAYGAPSGSPGAAGGDSSVIAAVFFDAEGRAYLHRIAYLTFEPERCEEVDEATQLCRQAAQFAQALHLPSIAVETNGVGRFLPGLLRQALGRAQVPCAVREMASRRAKDQRILEAFDAPLAAGMLYAHADVFATAFVREMREWRPGVAGARDDGLDAVAGCLTLEPQRLPRLPPAGRQRWRPGATGVRAPHAFDV